MKRIIFGLLIFAALAFGAHAQGIAGETAVDIPASVVVHDASDTPRFELVPQVTGFTGKVSWDASATPGVKYNVFRSNVAGGCGSTPTNCTKLTATALTVLTFTDAALPASGKLFYVVRAIDADGVESLNSNELAVILPPAAPANLRVG